MGPLWLQDRPKLDQKAKTTDKTGEDRTGTKRDRAKTAQTGSHPIFEWKSRLEVVGQTGLLEEFEEPDLA